MTEDWPTLLLLPVTVTAATSVDMALARNRQSFCGWPPA